MGLCFRGTLGRAGHLLTFGVIQWFLVQSPCTEETLIKGGQEPKRAAALLGAAYLETEPHGWDVWDIKDPHQGKSM